MPQNARRSSWRTALLDCQATLGRTKADLRQNALRATASGLGLLGGFALVLFLWGAIPKLGGVFGMLLGFGGLLFLVLAPFLGLGFLAKAAADLAGLGRRVRQAPCPRCGATHELLASVTSYACPCGLPFYLAAEPPRLMACPSCTAPAGLSPGFGDGHPLNCLNCGAATRLGTDGWRLAAPLQACPRCGREGAQDASFCAGCDEAGHGDPIALAPALARILAAGAGGRGADLDDASARAVDTLLARDAAGTLADGRRRSAALGRSMRAVGPDELVRASFEAFLFRDDGPVRTIEVLAAEAAEVAAQGRCQEAADLLAEADLHFARFLRAVLTRLQSDPVDDSVFLRGLADVYVPRRTEALSFLDAARRARFGAVSVKLQMRDLTVSPGATMRARVDDLGPLRTTIAALERSRPPAGEAQNEKAASHCVGV
jgi:hypothetical protein